MSRASHHSPFCDATQRKIDFRSAPKASQVNRTISHTKTAIAISNYGVGDRILGNDSSVFFAAEAKLPSRLLNEVHLIDN